MKDGLRRILRLMFLAVFVVSTLYLLQQVMDKRSGSESYAQALAVALTASENSGSVRPEEPTLETENTGPVWIPEPVDGDPQIPELEKINLSALREVNPDVVGWIRIPGTKVDYPILQGEDNEFYLKHTWQKERNSVGSVFLECRNSLSMTDYNTIVYGHNMNDGTMFATLPRYTDRQYRNKHPYVYVLTDAGVWRYEVFSMYQAHVEDITYSLSFQLTETKEKFIEHALQKSRYAMHITPEAEDRILTLSTCSSNQHKRWVVHARLKMIRPEP